MAATQYEPDVRDQAAHNFLRIVVDPGAENTNIDLVAVHGLNPTNTAFHAEQTWTKGNKMWLKDFLPQRVRTARIMLFGYNANVAFETSTAGVLEQAHNLLNWVRTKRRKENADHRPLIFIAHSLGGIVVKRALVVASQVERYKSIRTATYGMVFFATPHRGGEFVSLGKIAATIVRAVYHNPKNSFLESLEKDGLFANGMIDDFRSFLEDYQVISYYETRPLPNGIIVVNKKSAELGLSHNRERHAALDLDHRQICKFDRESDEYEMVEDNITEMIEDAIKKSKQSASASGVASPELIPASSTPVPVPSPGVPPTPFDADANMLAITYPAQESSIDKTSSSPGMPSRSSTFEQSMQSLVLSESTEGSEDRRKSSTTMTSAASIRSTTPSSSQPVKMQSPRLFQSITMNLGDSDGSSFRKAAANGQKDTVKRMLEKNVSIDNSGVGHGFTALAEASLNGHEDIVKLLLESGANPAFNCISTLKQFGSIENTPLGLAAGKGHLGCMRLLLDAHRYTTEELDRAYRAAKSRNRADAIKLLQANGGGLY